MSNNLVIEKKEDGILELTLALNENNVFNLESFKALDTALERTAAYEDISVMILKSNQAAYSTGLDPAAVHGRPEAEVKEICSYFFSAIDKLMRYPVPVIAEINGHCFGYGAILAVICDYRFMVDKGARFSFPEVNVGLGLPVLVTAFVQDLVGHAAGLDLLYTGKAFKGPDALAIGLVSEVHSAIDLEKKTRARAKKFTSQSKRAIRMIKRAAYDKYFKLSDLVKTQDDAGIISAMGDADAMEGFSAMLEKRRPKFT